MSVTNQFIHRIRALHAKFDAFEKRRISIENNYHISLKELEDITNRKCSDADKRKLQQLSSLSNNIDMPSRQLDDYLSVIVLYEGKLPPHIKKKGLVDRQTIVTTQIDFSELDVMLPKILDPTLWGTVKRAIKIDGYSSHEDMVSDYLQKLEQGRQYVQAEKQRLLTHSSQKKVAIEGDYKREMQIIKQKKSGAEQLFIKKDAESRKRLDQEIVAFLSGNEIPLVRNQLKKEYDLLGSRKENWIKYVPAKSYANELMLGSIRVPLPIPSLFKKEASALLAPFYIGDDVQVPFAVDFSEPVKVLVNYCDHNKAKVVSGFQSIVFRIIRSMPPNSFKVTFIDPMDRGTNLGRLQKLTALSGCGLCDKPAASRANITSQLKAIEAEVDEMSLKLATIGTIYDYNKTNDPVMEHNIVVIHDFPEGFDRTSLESLEVLINNAQKCGISIFISMKSGVPYDQSTVSFVNKIANQFLIIDEMKGSFAVKHGDSKYLFAFNNSAMVSEQYINQVKLDYEQGYVVNNSFSCLYNLSKPIKYKESIEKLIIPFAIDKGNKIVEIELGGPSTAHSMISGSTGSGKSTTLHALIAGIIMNYHPDDVELWLVDYKKVEFAEYRLNTPPHVKLIGLDKSEEFTFSLLEHLKVEFENRMQLFSREHVQNITAYKRAHGTRSLPRIVLVIDEFHNLTQAIQNEPYYMTLFENALLEYRALGLSCILSDQAISDGLRGLTEKGRKQLPNRIAMKNVLQEVKDTLSIDNSFYTESLLTKIKTLSTGDLIFKKESDNGTGEMQIVIDKYKSLYITQEDRNKMMHYLQQNLNGNFTLKEIVIVDGQKRGKFNQAEIKKYEQKYPDKNASLTHLYIGTPSSLDSCFRISIAPKMDANIMLIGSDDEIRMSILLSIVRCFTRNPNAEVVVVADRLDDLFKAYSAYWGKLESKRVRIITGFSEICKEISQLYDYVRGGCKNNVLLLALGFENLYEEMNFASQKIQVAALSTQSAFPSDRQSITAGLDALISGLDAQMAGLGNNSDFALNSQQTTHSRESNPAEDYSYDARDDFNEIVVRGNRLGYHTLLTFSSAKSLRRVWTIKPENFEHKIALNMSMDDSLTYLGNSRHASSLDDISAIYSDGSSSVKTFRPFLLPPIRSGS